MTEEEQGGAAARSHTPEARELFTGGHTCSVALVTRYAPDLGADAEVMARVAAGFAGGFGGLGEMCGALSGAVMVLGLRHAPGDPQDKQGRQALWELVRRYLADFEAAHGAVLCAELLERDISTTEGVVAAREDGAFERVCPAVVESAARLLETYLEDDGAASRE